jgi:hypothetical protein
MSLLATASPWNTTDETGISKKRTPSLNTTIRRTNRNRPMEQPSTGAGSSADTGSAYNDETIMSMGSGNSNPHLSLGELQSYNSEKQSRVHQLLDKITQVDSESTNGGGKLGDFAPILSNLSTSGKSAQNDLLPKQPTMIAQPAGRAGGLYMANDSSLGKYPNYRMAHDPSILRSASLPETSQYYSGRGNGSTGAVSVGHDERRLMEKINYMIHLLEEQQMEKTDNVMEEFILYSMLGVFVIYIVDSFSRAGKYMR